MPANSIWLSSIAPTPTRRIWRSTSISCCGTTMGKDAAPWLEKLRQQLPDDLGVCGLHARWLHNQHRDSEIEPAVEAFAERLLKKPSENDRQRIAHETQLSLGLGNIYTAVEQHSAAERWYRRLVKLAPQQYAPLAVSLGRQNRLGEAVARMRRDAGRADHSAQPAIVLAGVLSFQQDRPGRRKCFGLQSLCSPKPWQATPRTRTC